MDARGEGELISESESETREEDGCGVDGEMISESESETREEDGCAAG
jgi:hypothetical protein